MFIHGLCFLIVAKNQPFTQQPLNNVRLTSLFLASQILQPFRQNQVE
jgi:hypothetical protein